MPVSNSSSSLNVPSCAHIWSDCEKRCGHNWKWLYSSDLADEVFNKCGSYMRISKFNALSNKDL